jgi:preprotein translocase subunit SecE
MDYDRRFVLRAILTVAVVVAAIILVFFAIGYGLGRLFL